MTIGHAMSLITKKRVIHCHVLLADVGSVVTNVLPRKLCYICPRISSRQHVGTREKT
jgi:hypothetical protein